jgi:hypothetical protein
MKPRCWSRQAGAIAVEAALVLLACFMLLPFLLYFARLTLHAAVLQQAAFNAARYMATLPPEQIRDPALQTVALDVARGLVGQAVAGARLDTGPQAIEIECDSIDCGSLAVPGVPARIDVQLMLRFSDPFFLGGYTGAIVPYEFNLAFHAAQRYGN